MFVTSDKITPLAESIPAKDWEALDEFMFNPEPGMEYISEGYVGKTKEVKKIEAVIAKMIKTYKADGIVKNATAELDKSPEKREIENLIQKEFGFFSVEIDIRPSMLPGAGTVPKSILLRNNCNKMPTELTAHGEKWYDASHQYSFYMILSSDMFNGRFTAGEVTACILHEVGHNFDVSLMSYIGDCMLWGACIAYGDIITPTIGHIIAKYIHKFITWVSNLTPVALLQGAIDSFAKLVTQVAGPFGSLSYIGMMLAGTTVNVRGIIQMFIGFSGERFADSFVTAYGYGPEFISFIDKIDTVLQTRNQGLVIDTWTWSGTIAPTIVNMLIDPHPEAQTRARIVLDDMKKLLDNPNLPPKIKAAVKSDYERCKRSYDLFLQVDSDTRNAIALRFSRQTKEALLSGKLDLRTYLFNCSAVQAGISVVNHSKKK